MYTTGKFGSIFTGGASDFPTIKTTRQIDVGDESAILSLTTLQERDGLLASSRGRYLEASFCQRISDNTLHPLIIFDDKNNRQFHNVPHQNSQVHEWRYCLVPLLNATKCTQAKKFHWKLGKLASRHNRYQEACSPMCR
jgi:hypothetical protein